MLFVLTKSGLGTLLTVHIMLGQWSKQRKWVFMMRGAGDHEYCVETKNIFYNLLSC